MLAASVQTTGTTGGRRLKRWKPGRRIGHGRTLSREGSARNATKAAKAEQEEFRKLLRACRGRVAGDLRRKPIKTHQSGITHVLFLPVRLSTSGQRGCASPGQPAPRPPSPGTHMPPHRYFTRTLHRSYDARPWAGAHPYRNKASAPRCTTAAPTIPASAATKAGPAPRLFHSSWTA